MEPKPKQAYVELSLANARSLAGHLQRDLGVEANYREGKETLMARALHWYDTNGVKLAGDPRPGKTHEGDSTGPDDVRPTLEVPDMQPKLTPAGLELRAHVRFHPDADALPYVWLSVNGRDYRCERETEGIYLPIPVLEVLDHTTFDTYKYRADDRGGLVRVPVTVQRYHYSVGELVLWDPKKNEVVRKLGFIPDEFRYDYRAINGMYTDASAA